VERRETKLAETEALFREVNEGIAAAAARFDADEIEIVCECSDVHCAHRLTTSPAEYERVRREPAQFLLAPGHEAAGLERVVRRRAGYWVVEKMEATMRRIAYRLDPRRHPEPDASG
jgi:isopropylmalate/homocitrate/citramalate synthase